MAVSWSLPTPAVPVASPAGPTQLLHAWRAGHTLETRAVVQVDHEALDRLAAQDPRKAELIEWHYFGGLNQQEIAHARQVSLRTVERELRMARARLRRELQGA